MLEMKQISIRLIDLSDLNLIKDFIDNAGSSTKTFRYFEKRSLTCIKNHLVTLALMMDNRMVGYGHLDPAKDGVWLGIAVAESVKGKGFGKRLMESLLDHAKKKMNGTLKLTVDKVNDRAIALYTKFGFRMVGDVNESSILMELNVGN